MRISPGIIDLRVPGAAYTFTGVRSPNGTGLGILDSPGSPFAAREGATAPINISKYGNSTVSKDKNITPKE
jgi:hypothetical protein